MNELPFGAGEQKGRLRNGREGWSLHATLLPSQKFEQRSNRPDSLGTPGTEAPVVIIDLTRIFAQQIISRQLTIEHQASNH
jgi:hypothetical protein